MSKTFRIPLRKSMPKHLTQHLDRWFLLVRWGNFTAGYFGTPVYLVGSALRDDNDDPRDWDIRVRLPKFRFETMFGPTEEWVENRERGIVTRTYWRWVDECVKRSINGIRHTHLNIDFQVYPDILWKKFRAEPRLRLDTRR